MYLTRARIVPGTVGRATASRGLGSSAVDAGYALHQLVWTLFGDHPDRRRDFLYRLEEDARGARLLLLSDRPPEDPDGAFVLETKEFRPRLRAGDRLRFSLRANPVVTRKEGGAERGRRHDVVMDAKHRLGWKSLPLEKRPPLATLIHEAGREWLERRAAGYGFALDAAPLRVEGYQMRRLPQKDERAVLSTLDFDGSLTVTDPERLLAAVRAGIGPAKGFGCGLLLLARA